LEWPCSLRERFYLCRSRLKHQTLSPGMDSPYPEPTSRTKRARNQRRLRLANQQRLSDNRSSQCRRLEISRRSAGRHRLASIPFEILSFRPVRMRTPVLVWGLAKKASKTFPLFRSHANGLKSTLVSRQNYRTCSVRFFSRLRHFLLLFSDNLSWLTNCNRRRTVIFCAHLLR
jgi:hypothetical protein